MSNTLPAKGQPAAVATSNQKPAPCVVPNVATVMVLLHYHVFPHPLDDSNTVQKAIEFLKRNGMIEVVRKQTSEEHPYALTDKGVFWKDALMKTPLPVSRTVWAIPSAITGDEDE